MTIDRAESEDIDLSLLREDGDSGVDVPLTSKLAGQLAWLTRSEEEERGPINFDAVAQLASTALLMLNNHIDYLISLDEPVEHSSGLILWTPRHEDAPGVERKPTRDEVKDSIGEPELLSEAIEINFKSTEDATRLLAAFGVFCCERALEAQERMSVVVAMEMLSAAGILLGQATFLSGCLTGDELRNECYLFDRSRGGSERHEKSAIGESKVKIREKWMEWQANRSLYEGDREFCARMTLEFKKNAPADRVMRGWMWTWRQERYSSPS